MRLFREAGGAGDGGGLPPALSDILDDNEQQQSGWSGNNAPPADDPTKGKASDLSEAEQKAAAEKEAADKAAAEKATADKIAADKLAADKLAAEAGKTPEQIAEEKRLADEAAANDDDDSTEGTTPEEFYGKVEQITGLPVKVEYGETDPLSPEGLAMREQVVREDAIMKFDEFMRESDPRAYAYFQHRKAGRSDEDFFETKTTALPDFKTFEASVEAQSSLYKSTLMKGGIDPEIADAQLAKAIKDNTLLAKSTEMYNRQVAAEKAQLDNIDSQIAKDEKAFDTLCTTVTNKVNSQIDSTDMGLIIPDAKKPEFKKFVANTLRYDEGKFFIVQELGDNPKTLLESLYYKFINGDLKALVERKAETKTVQRMKLGVEKGKSAASKGSEAQKNNASYVPLGDL